MIANVKTKSYNALIKNKHISEWTNGIDNIRA